MVPLGRTGLHISPLSLGTVKFGRDQGVKYPQPVQIPDDDTANALLRVAASLGINCLDTAPAYGSSEERLGALLAGQREQWVLCTKVGEEFENGQSRYDFSPEHTRFSVERSLTRLRTDILDIVLIHSDGQDTEILQRHGTLETLQTLKKEGKIRAVGLSHKSVSGGQLAVHQGADVIMATLNTTHTTELGLIAAAGEAGCGVLIKKALLSGHGRPEDLAFVAEQPGVTSIVVGTTNTAHLKQNAYALMNASESRL